MYYQKVDKKVQPRLICCPGCQSEPEKHKVIHSLRVWHAGCFYGKSCRVVCCSACGLTFLNPQFSASDYFDFYRNDYFHNQAPGRNHTEDQFVDLMRDEMAYFLNPFIEANRNHLPIDPLYLDVGAGYFSAIELFAQKGIVDKRKAFALEPNLQAAEYLRNSLGIDVQTEVLENNPYPPASFNLVSAFALIEHVSDPLKAIQALRSALTLNGLLLLSTPSFDRAGLRHGPLMFFKVVHTLYFTKHALQHLLESNGFEVLKMDLRPALHDYNLLVCLARKKLVSEHHGYGDSCRSAAEEVKRVKRMIHACERAHPVMWLKHAVRCLFLRFGIRI